MFILRQQRNLPSAIKCGGGTQLRLLATDRHYPRQLVEQSPLEWPEHGLEHWGGCCPVPLVGTCQLVAALLLWIVRLLWGLREGVGRLLGSRVRSLSWALVVHWRVRHVVLAICVGVVAHGHGHLTIPDGEKETEHWVSEWSPTEWMPLLYNGQFSTRAFHSSRGREKSETVDLFPEKSIPVIN